MMETWRLLDTGVNDPAMNMAIDEAILTAHSQGLIPPTVRFYAWDPPTLSIGYFQRAKREVDFEQLQKHGLGFVRRQTGGRAVLHDKELTYSVVLAETHPLMPRSVNESYRVLSRGLMEGFRALGLSAEMVSLADEEDKKRYAGLGSAACFDSPSWYELVVEGRKVAGSAQTRQRGTILQHGSILLDLDADMLFDVLLFPSEEEREQMKRSFLEKAVSIKGCSGKDVSYEEAVHAFRTGFEKGLGIRLVQEGLTTFEQELAEQLRREKYSSDAWNFRR
jgi:lipoyl(octanoyl) transferase